MDIFKNSKDISEIVIVLQALIKSNNSSADRFVELNTILEAIIISHKGLKEQVDTLQQQVNHLNKELGIETHIHDGARDPS